MKKIVLKLEVVLFIILILYFAVRIYALANNNDYDCKDFKTQKEAQDAYERVEKDIYDLDRDGDKIACETLP